MTHENNVAYDTCPDCGMIHPRSISCLVQYSIPSNWTCPQCGTPHAIWVEECGCGLDPESTDDLRQPVITSGIFRVS